MRFEISGHVSRCSSIVWSSPIKECDATIVELDSLPPKVAGLSLSDEALAMRVLHEALIGAAVAEQVAAD